MAHAEKGNKLMPWEHRGGAPITRTRGEESAKASQRSGVWAESEGGAAAVSQMKTMVEKKWSK